jgi:hypothetical protein
VHVAVFPQASVALYVRVTVYRLAHVCPEITSPTKVFVTAPPQSSLAVKAEISGAGMSPAQETVTFAGQLIEGAVWSFMVTVFEAVVAHPPVSVNDTVSV